MIKIKNITATVKKYSDKYPQKEGMPDRVLSAKVPEGFVEIGAGWIKKDKNGNTFLSMKLSDEWKDHNNPTKSREGYVIVNERELDNLLQGINKLGVDVELPPSDLESF